MDYVFELDAEEVVYVIDALNNLDRPPEHQMRAILAPMSAKDAMEISAEARKLAGTDRDDPDWQARYLEFFEEVSFKRRVLRLENVKVKRDGKTVEITDAVEVFNLKDRNMAQIATDIRVGLNATGEIPGDTEKNSE